MFQNTIISDELSIYKFFNQLNFDFYLTNPQLKHLENIMNAMLKNLNNQYTLLLMTLYLKRLSPRQRL